MKYRELFIEFTKKYDNYNNSKLRGIGIEMELPIVSQKGEVVSVSIIQEMFEFLEKKSFELERDDFSNRIISASRINDESLRNFAYHIDTVMTDVGNSILEVVLAPQKNLHRIQEALLKIMNLLVTYFDTQNCKILGYGIQPITPPSRKLLMPKERYLFFENLSSNNIIPKSEGADVHLLTITASNQCHIDIGRKEAILAINVLNALSGLQIILHANSPIWKGNVDANYKANREVFWRHCYPDRLNQVGIPAYFQDMNDYIQYLLEFKPILVQREQLLQVLNKPTFRDFILDKTPTIGQTLEGKKMIVQPQITDIHDLNSFCYFNARLAPKFGTIESRMCCQQPPNALLAPTAITLGIIANLEEAKKIMEMYPFETWKKIRLDALKHTFKTSINGKSILSLLTKFLEVANKGLLKRNLGEEIFLEPLYERLSRQKSPADEAIDIFTNEGFQSFLDHYSFTASIISRPQQNLEKV